jgi:3-oxoacyl-(acyl-carrier-protein) synthase
MTAFIRGIGNISPQHSWEQDDYPGDIVLSEGNRLKCIEPGYKEFIKPIHMRRMSRTLKMGVAAAGKCLSDAGVEVPDAIIVGTGLGMMQDTEKFLTSILENEEKFLTPTSFIQSTHNTVGAHIAVMLKCNKYNFTYVNENLSFEGALLDSLLRTREHPGEKILLGGIDELTDAYFIITDNASLWKKEIKDNSRMLADKSPGSIAGEGSCFFIVSGEEHPDNYARFVGVDTFYMPANNEEVKDFIDEFLASNGTGLSDIDLLISGKNGDPANDAVFDEITNSFLAGIPIGYYKHLCGEYYTSTSFASWLAAMAIKTQKLPDYVMLNGQAVPEKFRNILIYNQTNNTNHALILLSAC